MTERDESTGQFTSDDPPLFGLAGVERDAGFIPLPDLREANDDGELTLEEAVEGLQGTSMADTRTYVDGNSYDDPEENPKETVTLERAGDELAAAEARAEDEAKEAELRAIRDEVDKLRGDPEAKPEAKEAQPAKEGELEPDLEKALNNAIASQISEAEAVRETYSKAVDTANEFARASFIENFPEIAGLPLEQWEGALAAMSQREPARFNKAVGTLNRVVQLQAAQQQQQQQRAESERVRLQAESAHFEETIKDVPRARRSEVESEIVGALKERGANMEKVVKFLRTSEASSALVMGLLWELGETRLQLKAIKSAPKAVASRNIPPVQRPGIARSRAETAGEDLQAMYRKLDSAGSMNQQLKIARRILGG